jgi:hypothetical protein
VYVPGLFLVAVRKNELYCSRFSNTEDQGYLAVTFSYIRNHLPEAYRVISWFVPPPYLLSLDSHIVVFDFVNVFVNSVTVAGRLS